MMSKQPLFGRILVPLDFTDKNVAALDVAVRLAVQNQSSVALLHVIEMVEHLAVDELKGFYSKLEAEARRRLGFPVSLFLEKGLTVEPEIGYGKRAEEIVNYAAANQVDLIVLSSHKFDEERPTQSLATISHKVAILAQCPVLLVK